jgi:DNA-binding IclR family transcriptional regulator
LPDNLRKTYLVVASKGECSATEVSNLTGRSRAIESSYLNQLTRMGWLTKRRNSKTLYFRVYTSHIKKHESLSTIAHLQTRNSSYEHHP